MMYYKYVIQCTVNPQAVGLQKSRNPGSFPNRFHILWNTWQHLDPSVSPETACLKH
jgi:hypothetical protein